MESVVIQAPPMRRKLLTLAEIATLKCIQNVAKLQDVGNAPFHLLKPVLKRMSVKQLKQIEQQNPHLEPESDVLWVSLLKKEFPDRPANITSIALGPHETMPHRALYFKYENERELFRKDSAARLRNMTEKLKKQKTANSIVAVPQLLKDPTVKRRTYNMTNSGYGFSRQTQGANKNSILSKARKDLRSRNLMFPDFKLKTKAYDPFSAFKTYTSSNIHNSPALSTPVSPVIRPPRINRTTKPYGETNRIKSTTALNTKKPSAFAKQKEVPNNNRASPTVATSEEKREVSDHKVSPLADKTLKTTSPSPQRPQPIKRKQEPSIFLTRVKRPRILKPKKPEKQPLKEQPSPPKRINAIKSSIFS